MRPLITGLMMLAATAVAHAEERTELPAFYENTWELKRPEETIWIYLNADGTWDGIFGGTFHSGRNWRTIDGNTCFFSPDSEPDSKGLCFRDLPAKKVGDVWQLTAVGRDLVWDVAIYPGRKVPPVAAAK